MKTVYFTCENCGKEHKYDCDESDKRQDGKHCDCWYVGLKCCICGDPALPELRDEGGYISNKHNRRRRRDH